MLGLANGNKGMIVVDIFIFVEIIAKIANNLYFTNS